eukprot:TRINITY_DN136_c0_g1_i6.p1 TRINITY_DN136_c0_g1~~TRINITY_DN136_c0_g1_i6.p1  ORF type:complete len:625 (+),score=153.57 TRINITY_DN136_c0_g1_i6:76-1950(+)
MAEPAAEQPVTEVDVKPAAKDEQKAMTDTELSWTKVILGSLGALLALYVFLVGLSLMGSSFKVLGGRGASSMFSSIENPIAGLMTGVLATVLVQSSSTSTSIVVSMVGAGTLGVKTGIPIIMGANIGTSVTNTIVSMGSVGDRIDLERAFSGATVHDMFNMLTVATLLPIEAIIGAIQGEGGPLYWITHAITEGLMGGDGGEELFDSPIKAITSPVAGTILKSNKYVIYGLTLPEPKVMQSQSTNTTLCNTVRRMSAAEDQTNAIGDTSRGLLNRRLADEAESVDCSKYYCFDKGLAKQMKKTKEEEYEELATCDGFILDNGGEPCGKQTCFLNDGYSFYDKKIKNGALLKGGFLKDAGDELGGIVGLIISIALLCGGLIALTTLLKMIFMSKAKSALKYATKLNDYIAMAIGVGITIIVQSSSVTTSALTPLCGVGALPLEKMLPLTLGANIGTTCTALIASLVSLKFDAVQIALCHLLFNITGILIWFPVPQMRQLPLKAARLLGLYASYYVAFPAVYIIIMFAVVPGVCLLISAIYGASIAGGVLVTLAGLAGLAAFEYLWWVGHPKGEALCYKVLSKEQREAGEAALKAANDALTGQAAAQVAAATGSTGSDEKPVVLDV